MTRLESIKNKDSLDLAEFFYKLDIPCNSCPAYKICKDIMSTASKGPDGLAGYNCIDIYMRWLEEDE